MPLEAAWKVVKKEPEPLPPPPPPGSHATLSLFLFEIRPVHVRERGWTTSFVVLIVPCSY